MNSRFLLLVCHSVMETSLCKVNLPVQVSFVTNPYSRKQTGIPARMCHW